MASAQSELVENGWRAVTAGIQALLQRVFPERFNRDESLLAVLDPGDENDAQRRSEAWHQFRHTFEELRLPSIGGQEYSLVHRCRHVVDCLIARDRTGLTDAMDQVVAYCDEFGIDISDEVESLEESLSALEAEGVTLIWAPPEPKIIVPAQLVALPNQLLHAVSADPKLLFTLSGRDFEILIADVLKKHGFDVFLTAATRDHGRDIIAVSSTLGMKTKYLIECKRYAQRRKVDIGIVQRLFGVVKSENANKGIVVTTSSFSSDARHFADQHPWQLELRELTDVLAWLRGASS
jgi:hypothetical protein